MARLDYDSLSTDIMSLRLPRPDGYLAADIVGATCEISADNRRYAERRNLHMLTNFGQHLLGKLIDDKFIEFNCGEKYECCPNAEYNLFESISQKTVTNRRRGSPLILTHEGEPTMIYKSEGEKSGIGLIDVPELGLHKGVFYEPAQTMLNGVETLVKMRTERAWSLPLSEIEPALPIRFSTFMLYELELDDAPSNPAYPHEVGMSYLVERAQEMLADDPRTPGISLRRLLN